jgi:hypothetical protein
MASKIFKLNTLLVVLGLISSINSKSVTYQQTLSKPGLNIIRAPSIISESWILRSHSTSMWSSQFHWQKPSTEPWSNKSLLESRRKPQKDQLQHRHNQTHRRSPEKLGHLCT